MAERVKVISEKDVIKFAFESGEVELKEEDIVVRKFSFNMGMKNKNPLECVSFYRESQDGLRYERVNKKLTEISLMMPEKVQSTVVRLFVKDEDKFLVA